MPSSRGSAADPNAPAYELFEVLGQRWALRVVWELAAGPMTYRELAGRIPGMSTSVLTQRLRDLRAAGLAEHRGDGYRLTDHGSQLREQLAGLADWAASVGFSAHDAE